jgi:hypothetical protein
MQQCSIELLLMNGASPLSLHSSTTAGNIKNKIQKNKPLTQLGFAALLLPLGAGGVR